MSKESKDADEGGKRQGSPRWLKYAGVGPSQSQKEAAGDGPPGAGVTSLGSLEAEVMGVLWEIGRPATGMEVMEYSLYRRRARGEEPAAFATITTTLRRLAQKGLLVSEKNAQRTPVYAPTVDREELAARVLNNVSQALLGRPLHALLPRLTGAPPDPVLSSARRGLDNVEVPAVDQLLQALEELATREAKAESDDDSEG